ncbi:MAG: endonuclease III [Anaerolineae bacterium]|nr:Endonuclease III [Anaerolineae bacterium]MEB2365042.1 endonuclease III [Chloroflexota bacterium]MBW7878121.1 endonuclease III [Anaerolineae bacterium]MCO6443346.1 endonuclease III [Anaerolineae bacterium]NOG48404.1 endonuclease III [Chloroflexota bacterium]
MARQTSDEKRRKAKVKPVFETLRGVYGDLEWQPGSDPMDVLVSCILSQNTSDTNRDRGYYAMKAKYPTWQDVVDAPTPELAEVLRPAGLSNQKAPRIQRVLERIYDERGAYNIDHLADMPLDEARAYLTSFNGIGPKTAAIVLCFGLGRPSFPVDTHVHRVGQRIGLLPNGISADNAHPVMERLFPVEWHYAGHIYLIRLGRDTCTARIPHCERCALTAYCDYFAALEPAKPKSKPKSASSKRGKS